MSKTILIVDDSSSVRTVVKAALMGAGYSVIEGVDGKDGISKLSGQKIHLIISDVNMPNMNGIEMVKEIKQMPDYKFTPICMLTTESEESKMAEGKAAGAKAWIVKPFQPPKLLDAVSKLVLP
ncbi:MAG: response regulator [Gammaproteobacteria bacterium]|nr:response regulator [Gammaproteobacteria bacterium]MCP4980999.1 response regulator [Gammaproteobacteria bacterium]